MMAEETDRTRVLDSETATAAIPTAAPEPTAMGATLPCPVCGTVNPSLETYCTECGFLLSSQPGTLSEEQQPACPYVLIDDRSGRRYPLHFGDNLIGREAGDVLLVDTTVSRRHAVLTIQDNTVTITDQGSTNGTRLDGSPIPQGVPQPVGSDSTLQFGNVTLRLEGPPTSQPAQAVPAETEQTHEEAPPGPPVAELRVVSGHPKDIPIPEGTITIGRRAGNDVVLSSDPFVSGRHAQITASAGVVQITDLGSTNGTFVNGTRLQPNVPTTLSDGDQLTIGQGVYVLALSAETPELLQETDAGETDAAFADSSEQKSQPEGDETTDDV